MVDVSSPAFLAFNLIHWENCEEDHKTKEFLKNLPEIPLPLLSNIGWLCYTKH